MLKNLNVNALAIISIFAIIGIIVQGLFTNFQSAIESINTNEIFWLSVIFGGCWLIAWVLWRFPNFRYLFTKEDGVDFGVLMPVIMIVLYVFITFVSTIMLILIYYLGCLIGTAVGGIVYVMFKDGLTRILTPTTPQHQIC